MANALLAIIVSGITAVTALVGALVFFALPLTLNSLVEAWMRCPQASNAAHDLLATM